MSYTVTIESNGPDACQNLADIKSLADDIADSKEPDFETIVFTKYYPATMIDPPEWDEEDATVRYSDLTDDITDDLKNRINEKLCDIAEDRTYASKEDFFDRLKADFDKSWNDIKDRWNRDNAETGQSIAQEEYEQRMEALAEQQYEYAYNYDD